MSKSPKILAEWGIFSLIPSQARFNLVTRSESQLTIESQFAAMAAPHIWGSVLYVGVISTTAGFVLWSKGLTYMDASIGGLFMFFQPVVGTLLGYLILDESITSYFVPGFLLIAVGVILAMRGGNTTAAEKLTRSKTWCCKFPHVQGAALLQIGWSWVERWSLFWPSYWS